MWRFKDRKRRNKALNVEWYAFGQEKALRFAISRRKLCIIDLKLESHLWSQTIWCGKGFCFINQKSNWKDRITVLRQITHKIGRI